MLNWFEQWMLTRTIKKLVRQGGQDRKITMLYGMITYYARNEYREDNKITLDHYLREIFEESLRIY